MIIIINCILSRLFILNYKNIKMRFLFVIVFIIDIGETDSDYFIDYIQLME